MRTSNFPNAQADSLPAEFVAETIDSLQDIGALGKITRSPDMDDEFDARVRQIIQFCQDRGLRPGIETLCCGLGISRTELHNWEKGENGRQCVSSRRVESVKKIRQLIYAFLEQSGLNGKLNPATYIWLSKNWMNYVDNVQIETKNDGQFEPQHSREEIASRYHQYVDLPEKPDFLD